MAQTERLYFEDSTVLEFSATVVEVRPADGPDLVAPVAPVALVALDKTAFYPTGGGQPNDTGYLGGAAVIDVTETEDGTIIHTLEGTAELKPGDKVTGRVDRDRRIDHMQQHTGQHILSQAFVQTCGAETRSFHLGAESSTVDIELSDPNDEHMRAAEELANSVVFDDRPVRVHLVSDAEAERLPLRKDSGVRGEIRVIEVEGFDWSPCGGTHALQTGQIGLIAIRSYERARKMTRVEFVCGRRALGDYRLANSTAVKVARQFSADRDAAPDLVARTLQDNKSLRKRVRELVQIAAESEAKSLLDEAESCGDFRVVTKALEGRDPEELRILAAKLCEMGPIVALLGARDGGAARLVFARSETLSHDMGKLLADACATIGGRGGGRPDLAQGGGPEADKLEEALEGAAERVRGGR